MLTHTLYKSALLAGVSVLASVPVLANAPADITEITVSATKNPVEAFSVPAAVSVVSKDEIDDLVVSSISDVFASVPGLTFDGGPRRNGETPALRGMAGEGVVVLFDGVRQNFLSGHDGRFFIEPDLLKSAEVVRGSGSALYGSGAVGGVISMNTVDAADLLKGSSRFGYRVSAGFQGANDEWMESGALYGKSADGKIDGLVSLTLRDSGDISLGDDTSLQSDDNIGSGIAKLTVKPVDDLTLSLSWMGYRNDATEPNNGLGNSTGDLMDKKIHSDTYRIGAAYNPKSNLVDLSFVGFINETSVKESDLDSTRVINRDVKTTGMTLDNRSRFTLGEKASLTLTYGGEYYHDEQVGTDTNTEDGTRGGVPDATADTLGLFVQAELKLETGLGDFYLIPGVRYDHFENDQQHDGLKTDESATSPRFAASWEPVEFFMVYGSYGEAFRAPSYNEIYADDIHFTIPLGGDVYASNTFVPNTDLKPERSKTWEFGAGFDFDSIFGESDSFAIKGSYFSSDVSDLIDLEVNMVFSTACFVPGYPGVCNAGTSRNINTTSAKLDGVEIEAVYDSPRFHAIASYATVNGKNKETDAYVGVLTPDHFYIAADVKVPELDGRIGARVTLASHFDKVNDVADERAAYEKLDLFAVWQPKGKLEGLRVDVGVDNVTDATIESVYAGVVDTGRNPKARIGWTGNF